MSFGDTYKNAVKCPRLLTLSASKSGIYATVGLIVHTFLPNTKGKRLPGLWAKLNAAKDAGLPLSQTDEEELLLWNDLRNAVSHAPPEQYRPIPFEESDLEEYAALLHRVLSKWRS